MRLCKIKLADGSRRVAVHDDEFVRLLDLTQVDGCRTLADVLHAPEPAGMAGFLVDPKARPIKADEVQFLAPIDRQEVWAAGVTYKRSQVAAWKSQRLVLRITTASTPPTVLNCSSKGAHRACPDRGNPCGCVTIAAGAYLNPNSRWSSIQR